MILIPAQTLRIFFRLTVCTVKIMNTISGKTSFIGGRKLEFCLAVSKNQMQNSIRRERNRILVSTLTEFGKDVE